MTRAELIEHWRKRLHTTRGSTVVHLVSGDFARATLAELEFLDMTPEQSAEKRLRERWPEAARAAVQKLDETLWAASLGEGRPYSPTYAFFSANGRTPDEAVDRLLERVK